MSYYEQGIEALSKSQIGKLLQGHSVRVKHGVEHAINLCEEHCKKLLKANTKGKGITIKLDPYAIHHNQHLRGRGHTGTDLGRVLGGITGRVATACGDRAIQEIGSGVPHISYGPASYNPTPAQLKFLKKQGVSISGGKLANKLKHGQQVMDFMGHNYQGIATEVSPVAKPIFQAGTQRVVGYINPMGQAESVGNSLKSFFGGAVKKNRGRPRKHGGNITPAGSEFVPY